VYDAKELIAITSAPRFVESDLANLKPHDLMTLAMSSSLSTGSKAAAAFRISHKITGVLNAAERAIVNQFKAKKETGELTSVQDVLGHFLKSAETYHSPAGMVIEKKVDEKVEKTIIEPALWVAPPGLIAEYPGIQNMVAMTISCTKLESGVIEPFVEDRFYQHVKFSGLDYTGLMAFATAVISRITPNIDLAVVKGNGRDWINALFTAFGVMSKEEYLHLHYILGTFVFNPCFVWGKIEQKKIVKTPFRHGAPKQVIIGIREGFDSSFLDASESVSGTALMKALGLPKKVVLPVYRGNMPISTHIPKVTCPMQAHEFMGQARNQRQADEKGLSAWSSGFGACGNPNKAQTRWNRKLSLILGALQTMNKQGTLMLYDSKPSEMLAIDAQLQRWKALQPTLFLNYKFYVPKKFGLEDLGDRTFTSEFFGTNDHVIYLDPIPFATPKYTEWAKMDLSAEKRMSDLFYPIISRNSKTAVSAVMHVFSSKFFEKVALGPKVGEMKLNVFTFGSVHNMLAIVSNRDKLALGSSDGTSHDNLAVTLKEPVEERSFLKLVVDHNIWRSGFMLYGGYYFNPNMNLVRNIPGKTINFVLGTVNTDSGHISYTDTHPLDDEPDEDVEDVRDLEYHTESEDGSDDSDDDQGQEVTNDDPSPPPVVHTNHSDGRKHPKNGNGYSTQKDSNGAVKSEKLDQNF
jgi:hypothetical protein